MVRSSNPNAATIACTGHPWASNVTTRRTVSAAVRRRYNTLPVGALNVLWHSWQMNRCSFCEWIPILPWPLWPLAGQCSLGQNVVVGSMTLLLAVRGKHCHEKYVWTPFALPLHHTTVRCGAIQTGSDRLDAWPHVQLPAIFPPARPGASLHRDDPTQSGPFETKSPSCA